MSSTVGGGAVLGDHQQVLLALRGGDAGQRAHLGVAHRAAGEGLAHPAQAPEGPGDAHLLAGGGRGDAALPVQPAGAGQAPLVGPAAGRVELADEVDEAGLAGGEVGGQLGDAVAEGFVGEPVHGGFLAAREDAPSVLVFRTVLKVSDTRTRVFSGKGSPGIRSGSSQSPVAGAAVHGAAAARGRAGIPHGVLPHAANRSAATPGLVPGLVPGATAAFLTSAPPADKRRSHAGAARERRPAVIEPAPGSSGRGHR